MTRVVSNSNIWTVAVFVKRPTSHSNTICQTIIVRADPLVYQKGKKNNDKRTNKRRNLCIEMACEMVIPFAFLDGVSDTGDWRIDIIARVFHLLCSSWDLRMLYDMCKSNLAIKFSGAKQNCSTCKKVIRFEFILFLLSHFLGLKQNKSKWSKGSSTCPL